MRQIQKLLSLKLIIESELLNIRIFLIKDILKIGQEEISIIYSALKSNPWTNKIKDLNREKIAGRFMKKFFLNIL